MSSTHCPDSAGAQEVRLCDGIFGAWDLVYFPPWILVVPAGFSQVLASISLGSRMARRGWRGFRGGAQGGAAGGGQSEVPQRWSLSKTSHHSWGDGGNRIVQAGANCE